MTDHDPGPVPDEQLDLSHGDAHTLREALVETIKTIDASIEAHRALWRRQQPLYDDPTTPYALVLDGELVLARANALLGLAVLARPDVAAVERALARRARMRGGLT